MLKRGFFTLMIALLAGACGGNNNIELTLVAENVALSTQISDIRSTATYETDRLQITVEFVQTAITQVAQQNQALAATLAKAGFDPTQIAQVSPAEIPFATPTARPAVIAPQTTDEAGNIQSQPTTADLLTPTVGAPTLYNIVTAAGVGSNDCALASVTVFPVTTAEIYVVATAANITPGTTLGSQWFNEGQLVVSHDFTPDFTIDQNCIWFFIDTSDTPFTPGNWSVQLTVNNVPTGNPVPFTITE
ncbi:MAG: hypothetical protein K8L97_07015 [Anaerolineae bacterium]|nr:hypothetical protein [Anaerolineae bacterium]